MAEQIRILISDEDPDSRVATRKVVQRAGFTLAGESGFGTQAVAAALEMGPDIVLLAAEEPTARSLETAEAILNALPSTPIVVYSKDGGAEAIRRAMIVGARDYLVRPLATAALRETVHRALAQEERRQMRQAGQLAGGLGRGTVIAVAGAKGGVGKSVLAVNLAISLRQQTGQRVALIDADTHFGDVATMLDFRPAKTVAHLLREMETVERPPVASYLAPHPSGIDVLGTPEDDEGWEKDAPERWPRLIDLVAASYDFVVVDTSGALDPFVRACMENATVTLLVTGGEVSSVLDTAAAIRRIGRWQIDEGRVRLVVNWGARGRGIKPVELAKAVGREVFWELPQDDRVSRSIQLGQPVVLSNSRTGLARSVAGLARSLAGTTRSLTAPAESKRGGLIRRIGALRLGRGKNDDANVAAAIRPG